MVTNGETVGATDQPSWPTPDDPAWADADEQTKQWLEATQPDAIAANLTDTVRNAFDAVSALSMFGGAYPEDAFDNAIAQLPPERAEVFKAQLAFVKAFSEREHVNRGAEDSLSENLFALVMKALDVRDAPTTE